MKLSAWTHAFLQAFSNYPALPISSMFEAILSCSIGLRSPLSELALRRHTAWLLPKSPQLSQLNQIYVLYRVG